MPTRVGCSGDDEHALRDDRGYNKAVTESLEPLMLRRDEGGIATLTLNRPEQRNGLFRALIGALDEALQRIAGEAETRVVVLAAAGPAFSAGHDLKELRAANDVTSHRAVFAACGALMQRILALPQPVIAQVQGVATAAGCQLVATCDLAIAAQSARFATPGVDIGLFCSTPMVALARVVPRKAALEMLYTGAMIDAAEAHRLGLVNRVVADGDLASAVHALARRIAGKSAAVVALGKRAFHRQIEMPTAEAYAAMAEVMAENLLLADAHEGIDAFLAKRAPRFQDR
ncbi:MAG: enoyl-CoA hydratase [Alphaproteobacteria bacterium]|nr:enoyl-CoA hydratase [Alphaproteobacteria bacterium]